MSNISIFNFKSSPVRVELINDEPHFSLRDVCKALNIKVASPERFRLNVKGVTKYVTPTLSGDQELTFINEPNLYRIIFRSNKKEAIEFQNWVFEEVLPQIRKTGGFLQNNRQITPLVAELNRNVTLTETELKTLAWLWKQAELMRQLIGAVEKPLTILGSRYAPAAVGFSREYHINIEQARLILARETAHIQADVFNRNGWGNVIYELREGKTHSSF